MITPEMLGIKRRGADYIDITNDAETGRLTIIMEWKDGKRERYVYKAVPTEEYYGQRYSPIKWVKVDDATC